MFLRFETKKGIDKKNAITLSYIYTGPVNICIASFVEIDQSIFSLALHTDNVKTKLFRFRGSQNRKATQISTSIPICTYSIQL